MAQAQRPPMLVAVDPERRPQGDISGGHQSERQRRSRRRPGFAGFQWVWVLALALALCGVLLAVQLERVGRLEGELRTLRSELALSRQSLEAYRQRMATVRGGLADLAAGVGELQALVEEDSAPEGPAER